MRRLMWFAIGFCGACALGVYTYSGWWGILLAAAVGVCALLCLPRKRHFGKIFTVILIGVCAGTLWYSGFSGLRLEKARAMDGQMASITLEVKDYSSETSYGSRVDGYLTIDGHTYQVRAYLNTKEALKPGDQVAGTFRFQFMADDWEGISSSCPGKGIFLLAYQSGSGTVTAAETIPLRYYPAMWRQRLLENIAAAFPEDVAGFAQALLLSERSELDYETEAAFQVTGISHIIAVSGLHVSILFSLVFLLTRRKRFWSAVIGVPVLLLFAAVIGFTPSVTRACLMQILLLTALVINREYDPPTALAFAVMVMLVGNPYVVSSISFQLSVGCVTGIFLFYRPISEWLTDSRRLGKIKGKGLLPAVKRWCVSSVAISVSANIMITPLVAYYYGCVSLIGVLGNLLTLWVVSFVFCGVLAAAFVGFLAMPVAKLLGWCVAWPMRYVVATAKFLSRFPLAAIYTRDSLYAAWLVGCYILLIVYLLGKRKPTVLFSTIAAVSLLAITAVSWLLPTMDDCRMTVLDVGQGQCILLQSGGRTFLVDCGGDYGEDAADAAAETLLSQGISRVDGMILTHFDEDHTGGVEYLLTRVETDVLLMPDYEIHTLGEREEAVLVNQILELAYGDTKLTLIPAEIGGSDNEWSMCVLFQTEKCDILITGDRSIQGELELLKQITLPDLEVLVVGHHGSGNSTSEALLAATTPDLAIISVGEGNRNGHPADEVLERLEEYGCSVLRTDQEGTIIYRGVTPWQRRREKLTPSRA